METTYPLNFARFYDTIYHHMRDDTDQKYFLDEIKKTRGRILEAGVGTGRLFSNAISEGADIYGLDISPEMLKVLYRKLPPDQHRRISLQNIMSFSYDFRFDLIIAPFRVMMHLAEKEDQLKAINNAWDHLNNGGRFIFDVFVPDLRQLINGLSNVIDYEGEYEKGKFLKRHVSTTPDLITQTILVNFDMEWQEGTNVMHDSWEIPLRFFFRYELEHLIERSKFRKYTITGDYHGNALQKDSREFIVTCEK